MEHRCDICRGAESEADRLLHINWIHASCKAQAIRSQSEKKQPQYPSGKKDFAAVVRKGKEKERGA